MLNVTTTSDSETINVYYNRIEVANKTAVYFAGTHQATVNSTGSTTTVNVVETPCELNVNTGGGNNLITVGIIYGSDPGSIATTHVANGWLSRGAVHKINVNGGDGNDYVAVNSLPSLIRFSGGNGNDTMFIKEYTIFDSMSKYPIGAYSAATNVETVLLERLQDLYTVVPGDNLTVIAKKFGVTIEQLVAWNGEQIRDPHWIYPGQVFIVGPYTTITEIIYDRS